MLVLVLDAEGGLPVERPSGTNDGTKADADTSVVPQATRPIAGPSVEYEHEYRSLRSLSTSTILKADIEG